MKVIRNPEILCRILMRQKCSDKTIGFVPTMGALHEGHLQLVRTARRENALTVVSIFVNPIQFGPKEDFKKYPRPIAKDAALLRKEIVDYLFLPSANGMYRKNYATIVDFMAARGEDSLSGLLCGKFRPGHFRGVATVVAKLLNIVRPDRAYFGAKDYQQALIVRRLIADLNMPVELRLHPTVRESDGLAMSSRNAYLQPEERVRACIISQTLFWIREQFLKGRRDLYVIRRQAMRCLKKGVDKIQYLEVVDPDTLKSLVKYRQKMVAITACYVGKTRLIDNVIINLRK